MSTLTNAFQTMVKDKNIIAAEVMYEYDEKVSFFRCWESLADLPIQFVFPRVNPIRKDVAVMTHQAEVVNVWED